MKDMLPVYLFSSFVRDIQDSLPAVEQSISKLDGFTDVYTDTFRVEKFKSEVSVMASKWAHHQAYCDSD